jgi:hypothetical protein
MTALRQEQSFNNDHKALIGNRPSGPYIVARMEPTARAKSTDVRTRHPAFRLWLRWRHHEIFDPDRKPSQANACRVPDCIRDRAGRARDADFANALDAKSVHVRIVFLDHERVQAW